MDAKGAGDRPGSGRCWTGKRDRLLPAGCATVGPVWQTSRVRYGRIASRGRKRLVDNMIVGAPANVSGVIGWLAGQARVMRAVALIKRPWVTNDVDCLSTSVRMLIS